MVDGTEKPSGYVRRWITGYKIRLTYVTTHKMSLLSWREGHLETGGPLISRGAIMKKDTETDVLEVVEITLNELQTMNKRIEELETALKMLTFVVQKEAEEDTES